MNIDAALARGRAAAELRMRDTVRLYKQDPDGFDRTTGTTVPGQQHTLYTGRARVKPPSTVGQDVASGEREVRTLQYVVELPWATVLPGGVRLLPGDRIEVQASRDPRAAGAVLYVLDAAYGDQVTAWRIRAEDRS